jgi:hypothetical protein
MADSGEKNKDRPFWETKTLDEMTDEEWESLCDGCGRCCLVKLEDEDTGFIVSTNIACHMFDDKTCRCKDYAYRFEKVPDCLNLSPKLVRELPWLPSSCAYKRIEEGRGLADWHPLISGDPETVFKAGISVRGKTVNEKDVPPEDLEDYAANWVEEKW